MIRTFPQFLKRLRIPKVAESCEVKLELGQVLLPEFSVPEGFDVPGYLRHLCLEGFNIVMGSTPEKVRNQLEYELTVINIGL